MHPFKRAAGFLLCALLCVTLVNGCAGIGSEQLPAQAEETKTDENDWRSESILQNKESGEGSVSKKEPAAEVKTAVSKENGANEIKEEDQMEPQGDEEAADLDEPDPEGEAPEIKEDASVPEESVHPEKEESETAAFSLPEDSRSPEILDTMSPEEKIAQMFVLLPEQLTGMGQVTQAGETTRAALLNFPVGGLLYMNGNLESYAQTQELLASTQQISFEVTGLPMFTFIDEEGGIVARVSGRFPEVPLIDSMAVYGSRGNEEEAFQIGQTMGSYLADLGFNCDCAPVADVLTNPYNSVIGERSFGSDAGLVAKMAVSLANGLESAGVTAVYKHFPGHGGTSADTHEGYASLEKTKEELYSCDLIPFQRAVENGAGMIMAAHITLPLVSENGLPASLNPDILTGILREELGYNGLIITDALNMGAVANQYTSGEAAVLAIQAGADLILMPADPYAAYQSVIDAFYAGVITEERINESVSRILEMKLTKLQAYE